MAIVRRGRGFWLVSIALVGFVFGKGFWRTTRAVDCEAIGPSAGLSRQFWS